MKIYQKLILTFTLVALLLVVIGGASLYAQRKIIYDAAYNEIGRIEGQFSNLISRDIKMLSASLDVFVRDQFYKDIFMMKDRDKLYEYTRPLFLELKEKYGITHLYFILPDGECFLRVHNRDMFGDQITRATFYEAKTTKKISSGIDLGKTAYALRAVMPYYYNGKLIGYVEFGEEMDHLLHLLKGDSCNTFCLVAVKKNLDREKWRSVNDAAGEEDTWDNMDDHLVVGKTGEIDENAGWKFHSEELIRRIEEGERLVYTLRAGAREYALGGFEIQDTWNRHTGELMCAVDITHLSDIAYRYKLFMIMISTLLFAGVLLLGGYTAYSISDPIRKIRNAMVALGKGKLDTRVDIDSDDEMGELAFSLNKMARDIKRAIEKEKVYTSLLAALKDEHLERKEEDKDDGATKSD